MSNVLRARGYGIIMQINRLITHNPRECTPTGNMDLCKNKSENFTESEDFTDDEYFKCVTLARGYTSLLILLVSFVFFVLGFCNLRRKHAHDRALCSCCCKYVLHYVANPFFLLALSSLLPVAAYGIVLYRQYKYLTQEFCKKGPGYLLEWFESVEALTLAAFSFYFLFYYIPFYNKSTTLSERTELNKPKLHKATIHSKWHSFWSVMSFVTILIICGLYNMPPAVGLEGGYGKEGPWCWIPDSDAQLYFWFIEDWVFMSISFVLQTAALVTLCCVTRHQHTKWRCFPKIWWDRMVFVPFLFFYIYFLLQFIFLAMEILVRRFEKNIKELWFAYAIAEPLSKLLLVVAALQLMSSSYRIVKKKDKLVQKYGADNETEPHSE